MFGYQTLQKLYIDDVLVVIVKLQVLGLRLGVDFTFTLENNDNNDNNPHLNFFTGTVLGDKD